MILVIEDKNKHHIWGWVISPNWAKFKWPRRAQGLKFKIQLPRSCVLRPTECKCQVLLMLAQQSQSLGFWKCWHHMGRRTDGHLTGFMSSQKKWLQAAADKWLQAAADKLLKQVQRTVSTSTIMKHSTAMTACSLAMKALKEMLSNPPEVRWNYRTLIDYFAKHIITSRQEKWEAGMKLRLTLSWSSVQMTAWCPPVMSAVLVPVSCWTSRQPGSGCSVRSTMLIDRTAGQCRSWSCFTANTYH